MDDHLFLSQSTIGCDTDQAEESDSPQELDIQRCNDSRHQTLAYLAKQVIMDYEELYEAYQLLQKKLSKTQKLLSEKDRQIRQLKTASEAVYNEYGKLQTKYTAEQDAMTGVMQQASQWYTQNQQLKRKSHLIVQKMAELKIEDIKIDEEEDEDKTKGELSQLLKTIEDLKREIGELRQKLHMTELSEKEARETAAAFKQQFEDEKKKHETKKDELSIVKKTIEQFENVSYLAVQEIADLHQQFKAEKRRSALVHMEVEQIKVEKKALAHQSALLLSQAPPSEKLMNALLEIEKLTKSLEEEKIAHKNEVESLRNELNQEQSNEIVDVLETKIKCLNNEIDILQKECKQYERKTKEMEQRVKHIEKQNLLLETSAAAVPPPPPPPPPPPLPQGSLLNPLNALMTIIGISKTTKALPASTTKTEDPRKAAMDQMLNKIKHGQFTLRRTRERGNDADSDAPEALVEMQKLLKSLKGKANDSSLTKKAESPEDTELFAVFRKKSIGLMSPEDKELIRKTFADANFKASARLEANGMDLERSQSQVEKNTATVSDPDHKKINNSLVRFHRKQSLDSALVQSTSNELQTAFKKWGVKSDHTT